MNEIYSWLADLDPMDDDAMMRAFTAVDFDEYSQEDQDILRHIIRTIRSAARNAALEEAAKVAGELEVSGKTTTMEWANCMAHARDIAQAIRDMKTASDPLLDMPGNGKEGV